MGQVRLDLHLHTDYSDSSMSIEETLALAKKAGIGVLSLTDHDHTETYAQARDLAKKLGIELIPGVEISAFDFKRKRRVHLLAYKYRDPALNIKRVCDPLLRRRDDKSRHQVKKILEAGYDLDMEALLPSKNSKRTLYKQHIMRALGEEDSLEPSYRSLYKELFGREGLAPGSMTYVDVFEALEAVLEDGGTPVLAHPGQMDSFDLVPELVGRGLAGIEAYHYSHSQEDEDRALALAEKYDLFITGGSDFHGTFGKNRVLGTRPLPEASLKALGLF